MGTDIARVDNPQDGQQGGVPANMQMPAFLQERQQAQAPKGTEGLREYFVPPRLKILQGQSGPNLKAAYGEGSVIVVPTNVPVAPMSQVPGVGAKPTPFTFIPLMQSVEWGVVNPKGVRGKDGEPLPFMRERSDDPNSELAKRARNFKVKGARQEPCPEDPSKLIRWQEFLNFLCIVENVPDLVDMPVMISFWSTGHADGRKLANLILCRNTDIFALRFEAMVGPRQNEKGNWYGLNISTPSQQPAFVQSQEEYRKYESMHDRFSAMRQEGTIRTEYDDEPIVTEATVVSEENAEY